MTAAIFSDLDGTLIFSARHLGDTKAEDLTLVETFRGNPQAWMTTRAVRELTEVRRGAPFIPVTTRVESQYRRVKLPGGPAEFAILGNGGRILVEGVEDQDWTDRMNDSSWGVGEPFVMADALERALGGEDWVHEIRAYDNIVCVAGRRTHPMPPLFATLLARFAEDNGYTAYPQGRKTHLIPTHVTKEAAAAEVASRLGATRTIASGDHHLDVGLMRWATEAIQPAHGVDAVGIPTTARAGVLAGEEAIAAFRRFAHSTAGGMATRQGASRTVGSVVMNSGRAAA